VSALQTVCGRLRKDFTRLARVAQSSVPLMVLGETGTGKELVSRAVHALSSRPGDFLAINCAALSESVLESELFGHRKGAFSGASESRPGLVRAADGGTLFLDEVGELPIRSQAKLLRVLQEGEVHPLGETHPVRVDVRMITATHRNLVAQIGKGGFRDDFYGRLAGYEIALLPLRARKEDLGLLTSVLLRRIAGTKVEAMTLQAEAARALFVYDWPRNVRELDLALAAAAALSDDGKIRYDYLPGLIRRRASEPSPPPVEEVKDLKLTLSTLFERYDGNLSAVARELGKERVQIRRWCKRFQLDPANFRK
jgi:transcriptional regulator with GAF, ATPase, and Fis domain